jgi:Tfp pilus assembly protein PilW
MVELMIAMVLSSIVVYAGISMFLASRGTASTTAAVGAVTDSGRVALDFIADTVRGGGALQCNSTNGNSLVPLKNNINSGGDPLLLNYTNAFDGFEAAGTGVGGALSIGSGAVTADGAANDWSTSGGGALDALLIGRVVKGSDILAVRESVPESAPAYTTVNYNPGGTSLTVANVQTLQPQQYAVITNCAFATVFQINTVDSVTSTITTNGPLDTTGDLGQTYDVNSMINALDMTVYFIAPGRDTDSALYSYDEWTGQFQQLVPDVENMQVLYGIATAAQPNQVTSYVTADLVPNFDQVISVQVALLVASPPGMRAVAPAAQPPFNLLNTSVTAPADGRLRRVFVTTIAVENASG